MTPEARLAIICTLTQVSKRSRASSCCAPLAELLRPRLFKALCDPNRLALVARLASCGRPCTVSEMAACCPIDLSVTSRHLALLREAGVVAAERRGKEVHYSIRVQELASWLRATADALESCCTPSAQGRKAR